MKLKPSRLVVQKLVREILGQRSTPPMEVWISARAEPARLSRAGRSSRILGTRPGTLFITHAGPRRQWMAYLRVSLLFHPLDQGPRMGICLDGDRNDPL